MENARALEHPLPFSPILIQAVRIDAAQKTAKRRGLNTRKNIADDHSALRQDYPTPTPIMPLTLQKQYELDVGKMPPRLSMDCHRQR